MDYKKLSETLLKEQLLSSKDKITSLLDLMKTQSVNDFQLVSSTSSMTSIKVGGLTFKFIHTNNKLLGLTSPNNEFLDLSNKRFTHYLKIALIGFIMTEINNFITKNSY